MKLLAEESDLFETESEREREREREKKTNL